MKSLGLLWLAALAFLAAVLGHSAAQAQDATTPKMMTWVYECKAGTQCPSSCRTGDKELFSTSDYVSITLSRVGGRTFWIKIDTGAKIVEYVTDGTALTCTIVGAKLASARYQEPNVGGAVAK